MKSWKLQFVRYMQVFMVQENWFVVGLLLLLCFLPLVFDVSICLGPSRQLINYIC